STRFCPDCERPCRLRHRSCGLHSRFVLRAAGGAAAFLRRGDRLMRLQSRRAFLSGLSSAALGGFASTMMSRPALAMPWTRLPPPAAGDEALVERAAVMDIAQHYGTVSGERFPVPAVNLRQIDQAFLIKTVSYDGAEEPGTIVINPDMRFLYLVQ